MNDSTRDQGGRLFGVLVTFRRPTELRVMLQRVIDQTQRLEMLVVVDNEPSPESSAAIAMYADRRPVEHVQSPKNLGPAGGTAFGMARVLELADEREWILLLDDDDPPDTPTLFEELLGFAEAMPSRDPRVGAVGLAGARFDARRARVTMLADEELGGPVQVDWIAGNRFPFYLVRAVKEVGPFRSSFFFGFEELEYGLRLKAAGYSLYACGPLLQEHRAHWARDSSEKGQTGPRRRLAAPEWRRYYSLRNLVYLLRERGQMRAAVWVILVRGLAKPLVSLPVNPRLALQNLRLNVLACRDGWRGRLGRTLEPPREPT